MFRSSGFSFDREQKDKRQDTKTQIFCYQKGENRYGENTQQNRCKGKTKQGKPCQAAATAGGLCFFHANPDKAAELGRVGGQKNRLWASSEHTSLPVLNNAVAVRETVARLISEIYEGQLHPRIAAGLGPLLNLQLRAIELTNHEQRIAALERGRKETEAKDDSDPEQEFEAAGSEAEKKL